MNSEIFAEWLRRQGHHVVQTESSYWHSVGPRVYQAFPYHWVIKIPDAELKQFLHNQRAVGLRYSTPANSTLGAVSYHAVYDRKSYTLSMLSKWSRKNVRRGLKNCSIEPISFKRLSTEGYFLQIDTLLRQGRNLKVTKSIWQRRCLAASELPGFEAWGALVDGHLAASLITFQMEDWAYMLYQQCHRDYLALYVNNALSFSVTQTLLERAKIRSILYGLHSLDAPASVDEFKFRMAYKPKPVRQRVVFHPVIAPLFNRTSHLALVKLKGWRSSSPVLCKAEGMLRFYVEGKRPILNQNWPTCLKDRKIEIQKNFEVGRSCSDCVA